MSHEKVSVGRRVFGDAARITLPGPDLGTGGELGVSSGNTLPEIDLGAAGRWVAPLEPLH